MEKKTKLLITVPESPYKILSASFNDDTKAINQAFRALFKKDPKKGMKIGGQAQKKLSNPQERMKQDAFCYEADLPEINLTNLKKHQHFDIQEVFCQPFENPLVLTDLYFSPENSKPDIEEINFRQIEYRPDDYEKGNKNE